MEDSIRSELAEVDSQLTCLDHELESLLQRQQDLLERKQLLTAQLESIESSDSNVDQDEGAPVIGKETDWERGSFPWSSKVRATLKSHFKLGTFRPLQLSCINATLARKDTILVMPTGGGKSLCYQLPALVSEGFTLVVSPLISLMEDQLMAVRRLGIESRLLKTSVPREEINRVHAAMTDPTGSLRLLYVTPERLAKSKRFMSKLEKAYEQGRLSRIVIDEVHCASQWGHDFRPDYKILGVLKRQFPTTPLLGLTATATAKVLADCRDMLSLKRCLVFRASYNRENLFYEVRGKASCHDDQVSALAELILESFKDESGEQFPLASSLVLCYC